MKRIAFVLMVSGASCFLFQIAAIAQTQQGAQKTQTNDDYKFIDVNNVLMWMSNNGSMSHNPTTDKSGFEWPKGSGKTAVYQDGLVFAGRTAGLTFAGGSMERQGLQAGIILPDGLPSDPNDPQYRIYKVRNIGSAAFDALSITEQLALRKDFTEWPAKDGAPYIDSNHNGMYDPDFDAWLQDSTHSDKPWFVGDEVLWFVSNDMDMIRTQDFYGTNPARVEMQTMVWAYTGAGPLPNTIFVKHTLINKNYYDITQCYFAKWSKLDLGNPDDDLMGFDEALSLGYVYNNSGTDDAYGIPPAFGYVLLQGPIVPSSDAGPASYNFGYRAGYENLPVTAFVCNADSIVWYSHGGPNGTIPLMNLLEGLNGAAGGIYNPQTNERTKIMFPGDPVTSTGWIDGSPFTPGNRKMLMSCGSFTLAAGDTQEIVFAALIAQGNDRLNSIRQLRSAASMARNTYKQIYPPLTRVDNPAIGSINGAFALGQNYPNPFGAGISQTSSTVIPVSLTKSGKVDLQIYDIFGRRIASVFDGVLGAGRHELRFSPPRELPSGLYLAVLSAGYERASVRMTILR